MVDIQITDIRPDHFPQLQNLLFETWLSTYPNPDLGVTKEDIESFFAPRLTAEHIKTAQNNFGDIIKNQIIKLAFVKNTLVGVVKVSLEPTHSELTTIYVLPKFQGQKIGFRLWQAVLPEIPKSKKVILRVANYNDQAINFYKKLGFVLNGTGLCDIRVQMPVSLVYIPLAEMELTF